jgi:hypothetical protein
MGYLDLARKAKEEYRRKRQAGTPSEPASVDIVIDETVVAVLIDSTVLGTEIWFALDEGFRPDPGDATPVFYASELPFLRTKSPETLREIFKVKTVFRGGRVRQ